MTVPPEMLVAQVDSPAVRVGVSCFSTLGCPEMTLAGLVALAREFDIPYVELRSLENRTDLPILFADSPGGWSGVRETFLCQQIRPRILGTSFKLIGSDEKLWQELLDFARLAEVLEVPWLRVFSGGAWGVPLSSGDYRQAVASLQRWRREKKAHGWSVDLLVETHDAFSASAPCMGLQDLIDEPVGLIWDSHHTWRLGGEEPFETWSALSPYVKHVHVKDSVAIPSARHPFTYVIPGDGEMPLFGVMELLFRDGYSGAVSLEWEKMWHPYLPPLAQALAACRERGWL